MSISRKDFVMIADTIRRLRGEIPEKHVDAVASAFCSAISRHTSNFDAARFMAATEERKNAKKTDS